MIVRGSLAACVLCFAGLAVAQEASPSGAEAGSKEPAAAEEATPEEAEFTRLFVEWKGVIQQLQGMREKYRTASEAEKADLQKQWKESLAKGNDLLNKLREQSLTAYQAKPGGNPAITQFLIEAGAEAFGRDDYETAWRMMKPLLDAEPTTDELRGMRAAAGVTAFTQNDFDTAKKLLREAETAGILEPEDKIYLDQLSSYRELWAKEQKLREAEAQADDLPRVLIKTTKGDILIELFENEAPNTVASFLSLVEKGFYNGTVFHRVLPGFMAQGGDPTGTGSGGPGYTIACECYQENRRDHFRGSLSMAHGGRDTGGSQFFLTFRPTPHLNGKHTVFGRVLEGFDVLANLQRIDPEKPRPVVADKIVSATVVRKRDHAYEPKTTPE